MFGSMSCKAHQAHIALSEPITSVVQQGSSLGLNSIPTPILIDLESIAVWWETDKYPLGSRSLRSQRKESVTSPSSVGSGSIPSDQAAESGVCVLITNRSRGRGIQPIKAADPAQPTRPITAAFLIQTALHRKSYNQTALLRANIRKSSEITFGLLITPSGQILWDNDAAASTNCWPALA